MIAIIEGCGVNISSVQFALTRLGYQSVLTTDLKTIKSASHVILPGVGTANYAMQQLKTAGLIELIRSLQQPILCICLGMQLLFEFSEEGNTECLGVIPGKVKLIPAVPGLPIPHMGWNQLQIVDTQSPLVKDISNDSHVYFVHSYSAEVTSATLATTNYGKIFSAMVRQRNFYGMQFHPERSGKIGKRFLENFLKLN
ncbi:MAG: imidazole glycerol phosphate synthase subunit HisH [Gammaproteobacteria bacterium]